MSTSSVLATDENSRRGFMRYFGTSERFWLNLQDRYDIDVERDRLGPTLDEIRPLVQA